MRKFMLLVLFVLLMAACGPRLEEEVIGRWERVDGELWPAVVEVELAPEGEATVTVQEGEGTAEMPYEWSIEGGDFCANWDSPTLVCYQMELDGDNMTLLDIRLDSVTLRRVN